MLSELKEAILHYIPVFLIVLFVLSRYKMKIYDLKLYSTGRVYEGNGDSNLHFLACVVYTFLITGMVSAAGIPSVIDFGFGRNYFNFNFIPFAVNGVSTNILNVIMFVPFGFMLPIMWNEFESFKKTVFYSGSEFVNLTVLTIVSYAIIGSLVRNYCFLFI